jgi:hypothetical protein
MGRFAGKTEFRHPHPVEELKRHLGGVVGFLASELCRELTKEKREAGPAARVSQPWDLLEGIWIPSAFPGPRDEWLRD